MSIKQFIEDRKTPYSEITNVKVNKDGNITYTEKYNLKHPMCPIVSIDGFSKTLLTLNQHLPKANFEILYGTATVITEETCDTCSHPIITPGYCDYCATEIKKDERVVPLR